MKKRKSALALLMSILMLASLFTGCGSEQSAASEPVSVSDHYTAEPSSVQPESESSQPDEPIASIPEASSAEESEAEPEEAADPALPYADDAALSLWTSAPNMMGPASVLGISSYADFSTTQYAEELTGISINWIEVTYETMSEQFNILVASGDSPDLMYNAITMYNGGGGKAFEDGILANLSEYLEENAPNYCAYLNADEKMMLESKDDEDHILAFYSMNDEYIANSGDVIRGDWLDALNFEVPSTYSELTEVLTAFKNTYDCSMPFSYNSSCKMLTQGFDVASFDLAEPTLPLFVADGDVKCSLNSEGYRNYLRQMHEWFDAGIIGQNFAEISGRSFMSGETDAYVASGNIGYWNTQLNGLQSAEELVNDAAYYLVPVGFIGQASESVNHVDSVARYNTNTSMSVATGCDDIAFAVKWMNFWYTSDGDLLYNYGLEGEAYEIVDGNVQYLDSVLNNEYGIEATQYLRALCTNGMLLGRTIQSRMFCFYDDLQMDAISAWSDRVDGSMVLPNLSLTADEMDVVTTYGAEITTLASEKVIRFINGELDIETDWDAFQSELESM